MKRSVLLLCLFCHAVLAQSPVGEFPEGAHPLSADTLKEAISGKVFSVNPALGPAWRLQFKPDGYYFMNAGNYYDSGKWNIKESALCTEPHKGKPSCNEIRAAGTDHYLKRDSGEIVKLVAQ